MSKQKYESYFKGKVIWLTGASKGIGLSLAKLLGGYGARLAITSRNQKQLEKVAADISSEDILVVAGDVTQKNANKEMVEIIVTHFGHLDMVILNAGTAEYVDIPEFDSSIFERQIATNYLSIVYGVEASLPHLLQRRGSHLIAMSSAVAFAGLPRGEAYGASKAAVRNMFQGLRIHLRPKDVNVQYICPGFVKTPLTEKNDFPMPLQITSDEAAAHIAKGIAKQKGEIHFPSLFTLIYKFFSYLPNGLYTRLMAPTLRQDS
jgi:short-subunit dehydrogenase